MWKADLREVEMSDPCLQSVTAARLAEMDPEFAFIDWREPEAAPYAADGNRAELRLTNVDPQIHVAPGHAVC